MTHAKIIEAVHLLNQEMYENTECEYMYLEYKTNGWGSRVSFMGVDIWDDDADTREYDEEDDDYEPIEDCLRRELSGHIQKTQGLLTPNPPQQ